MADEATPIELTMPRTRSELLSLLRSEPFNYGGQDNIVEVKSFMADNEIEIADDNGALDIDAVWKKTILAPVVKFSRTEDDRAADIVSKAGKLNRQTSANVNTKAQPLTAEQHMKIALRKQYDRKAAKGETVFPDADTAEHFAAMVRFCCTGGTAKMAEYGQYKSDLEVLQKAASTGNNVTGGAFVPPPELSLALIELREKYGVFEASAKFEDMANDRKLLARNVTDQTVYWTGENAAGTQSDPVLDNPSLTANKLIGLSLNSNEILNDNAISVADMTARSFARQSAYKIDLAAFLGTGTNVYGGFVGLDTAFLNISATRANIAGAQVGTGDLWSEITLNDLIYTQARLPAYAQMNAKWYMPSQAYFAMSNRLGLAAGGVTYSEVAGPSPMFRFLGSPVVFVQAMSPVGLSGTVYRDHFMAYYGDLSLSSSFGRVRNSLAFEVSTEYAFNTDQVALRYRERVAILNHDVGGDTSTTPAGVAGPIVGLLGAAS